MQTLQIMKFGGSSVADAARIETVATIIASEAKTSQLVVVASAMGGVTDTLISAYMAATAGDGDAAMAHIHEIEQRNMAVATDLPLNDTQKDELINHIHVLEKALAGEIKKIATSQQTDKKMYDRVLSYGERTSVLLVAAALNAKNITASAVEASHFIVTNSKFGDAEPILEASRQKANDILVPMIAKNVIPVVTGFIGATSKGEITTLGRGASDYTSTILGFCLDATKVTIWTDVTGVMTADPRVISDAQTISALSYEEAAELSFYGAKVLHPLTMLPVAQKNIPIYIKNTFEPAAKGTKIAAHGARKTGNVKAITTLSGLSMIRVRGAGATSALQHLAKIIDALLEKKIEIISLQQSSSDHNTLIVVRHYVAQEAAECIAKIMITHVDSDQKIIQIMPKISIVAVVGAGIHTLPGLASRVFSALAVSGVEAAMIAYGSSKHNLTFAIQTADEHNAIKSLHQAFELVAEGDE